ncbi:MAG: hypothetical protein Q8R05_00020 [Candidatus Omnitrophota bacterium]|nr:hypothetical protein [Candidatus Omnitrophota bacterium]
MTAKQKKKGKDFLHTLHSKYYGKAKSKAKEAKAPAKTPEKSKPGVALTSGQSRNELMLAAKAKGIKNFRILNKSELIEVLKEGTSQERTSEIIGGAVARWKSGWGTGKKKEKASV